MTIKEYITSKLEPLNITLSAADWVDIESIIPVDAEATPGNIDISLRVLTVDVLPFYVNQAKSESISENGFSRSVSFDVNGLLTFYNWLCKKYGIDNVLEKKPTVKFL